MVEGLKKIAKKKSSFYQLDPKNKFEFKDSISMFT